MTLQVGDKVIVFNAGTELARAVKWDPVEVGDKVTVVTLSDGTKCALPRLSLDVGDYVFVIPVWDNNFDLNGEPRWEMLSLGMCVFTLTGRDCYFVEDDMREWTPGELSGLYLINVTMISRIRNKRDFPVFYTDPDDILALNTFLIDGNNETQYSIRRLEEVLPPRDLSFDLGGDQIWEILLPTTHYVNPTSLIGSLFCHQLLNYSWSWSWTCALQQRCNISGSHTITFKFRFRCYWGLGASTPSMQFSFTGIGKVNGFSVWCGSNPMQPGNIVVGDYNPSVGCNTNASYPDYDIYQINLATAMPGWNPDLYHYDTLFGIEMHLGNNAEQRPYTDFELDDVVFSGLTANCTTGGLLIGDQYVIYDPVNKKLVANDAAKTVLAAANWRAVVTPGEEITLAAVEYAWDGAGYVYLTSSKTTFAQIAYHTQIRITAMAAGETKIIDWHTGAAYSYDGLTISSEMTHITSILRAGKNTITISVRDVSSAKIGFAAPVYIRRNMAALH